VAAVADGHPDVVIDEAASASLRRLPEAVAAFRSRDFTLFWSGALVSNIGTWMQNVTVPFVLYYRLTHSAAWVGLAAFVQLFPSVLVAPLAGALAERMDRRRVLIVSQVVQGLQPLALRGVWVGGVRSPTVMVVLVGCGGLAFGAVMPSWQAFLTELVPRDDLLNAVTLNSAQFNGARALGPAVGGLVLGRFGPSWAFLFNALSFLAVIAALALIRPRAVSRQSVRRRVLREFADGIAYARRHGGILVAMAIVMAVFFLGNPVFQLAPVFAKRVYRVGPGLYGLLTAAYGIGAVIGAGILGVLGRRWPRSRLVVSSVLLYAAGLVGFGLARTYAVGWLFLLVTGVAFLGAVATTNTSVQLLVAEEVRGRVLALYMMALTSSYPLGALLQGWLADRIGAPTTVIVAGSLLGVVGLLLLFRPGLAALLDEHTHRRAFASDPVLDAQPAAG
jgi:MFS family permease